MTSSAATRVSGVYVWVQIQGEPVLAGRFEHHGATGTFFYANSYIARRDAFALDPLNLPLIGEREFHTQANGGIFGVLLDAGPDRWGQRVLSRLASSRPRTALEYLLAGNGDGSGCLLFSLSRSRVKRPKLRGAPSDLAVLARAAQSLLRDEEVSAEMKQALMRQSASMGGARPKASITVDGVPYLAKFNCDSDLFNEARAEWASLNMADALGIEVPERKLHHCQATGQDVLLVRRFDYDVAGHKRHYLSAHALLNLHKAQEQNPDHGYPGVAHALRQVAAEPLKSARELYRRMCFRALIGDTDDHGRNHGFLLGRNGKGLEHAPLFDVLPHPNILGEQAMPVGKAGRATTFANLVSMPEAFGLTRQEALAEIQAQLPVLSRWREYFAEAGMSDAELRVLEPSLRLVDEGLALATGWQ